MSNPSNRRQLISSALSRISKTEAAVDSPIGHLELAAPESRATLRLTARAMACEFSVIMNAGEHEAIWQCSEALDGLEPLEQQLSAYRESSEVSQLNATAHDSPVKVAEDLYCLLKLAQQLSEDTGSAFDVTSGPLIQLWRHCRSELRIPSDSELAARISQVGMQHLVFNDDDRSLFFGKPGVSINLGAIGKGHALDETIRKLDDLGMEDLLLHGGHSSVVARGAHLGCDGWPVGLGNPLLTNRRLGTIVLKQQAMSTSGSNTQHFRIGEKRYGHILDPRTGWPSEGRLSVTVIAKSAAVADALSTAFYVMSLEEIQGFCENRPGVGAIIIPLPTNDRRVRPHVFGVDLAELYWDKEQIRV